MKYKKYSEVKPVLKKLHQLGWQKDRLLLGYRKIWRQGDLRVGQIMTVDEIFNSYVPLEDILGFYEKKAKYAFEKHMEKEHETIGQ